MHQVNLGSLCREAYDIYTCEEKNKAQGGGGGGTEQKFWRGYVAGPPET